jgi:hypothetical protein
LPSLELDLDEGRRIPFLLSADDDLESSLAGSGLFLSSDGAGECAPKYENICNKHIALSLQDAFYILNNNLSNMRVKIEI